MRGSFPVGHIALSAIGQPYTNQFKEKSSRIYLVVVVLSHLRDGA